MCPVCLYDIIPVASSCVGCLFPVFNYMGYSPILPGFRFASETASPNCTEMLVMDPPRTCSICLRDDLVVGTRLSECKHAFHTHCIREWMDLKPTCPVCRKHVV